MGESTVRDQRTSEVLTIEDLHVVFDARGRRVHAVNGVSLSVNAGETLGLVGESGSGKSATAMAVLGLLAREGRVTGGRAYLDGRDLLSMSNSELRQVRRSEISVVFQDSMTALNPVLKVGHQIAESVRGRFDVGRKEARNRAVELLERVGIPSPDTRAEQYPHEFSGGMRQRAMIAMAIACEPRLLIADEPTTALDVTIQAQVIELMKELVEGSHMAMMLITHDLGLVAGMCKRVAVLYGGIVVEEGDSTMLFTSPRHPYTLGLLQSVPRLGAGPDDRLRPIDGSPRDMLSPPSGCPFRDRCEYRIDRCDSEVPALDRVGLEGRVACFNPVDATTSLGDRVRGSR